MIDEFGRLVKAPFSINIAYENTIKLIEQWLSDPSYNGVLIRKEKPFQKIDDPKAAEAEVLFQRGIELLKTGKKEETLAEWSKALALDPNNWLIHKQIWVVRNPGKFYNGNVDYAWQKQQLEAEAEQKQYK